MSLPSEAFESSKKPSSGRFRLRFCYIPLPNPIIFDIGYKAEGTRAWLL
jgi:hypothetical protein